MSGEKARVGPGRNIYAGRRLEAIAARWDRRAESWDRELEGPECHLNEDSAYDRFMVFVGKLLGKRRKFCAQHGVIDAGCGTGLVLAEAAGAFAWAVGIDISPRMIRVARGKRLSKTRFMVGDCFQMAALCPRAGAVLSRGVLLSHYGRRQGRKFLKAARASLVPGGFLVFDFLNEAAQNRHRHVPENKTWFQGEEMERMARGAGFSAVTIAGSARRRVLLALAET